MRRRDESGLAEVTPAGTHQSGRAATLRAATTHSAAVIDTAAMPVRIERWRADGKAFYRVIGHHLGRQQADQRARDPFPSRQEPWVPVENCPTCRSTLVLEPLDAHVDARRNPGSYQIVLTRARIRTIRTRRLDLFFTTSGRSTIDDV